MTDAKICEICKKPKVALKGLSITQWIFHQGSCYCEPQRALMQRKTHVDLCRKCGKPMANVRSGSLTQWIFHPSRCSCSLEDSGLKAPEAGARFPDDTIDSVSSSIDVNIDSALTLELGLDPERYGVIEVLGRENSTVYKCRDMLLNRLVAIKILSGKAWNDSQIVDFQFEARITSELTHPNIVRTLDFGISANNAPYLVMEYVHGVTLARAIESSSRLDLESATALALQVTSGMAYVHNKNIIHRDLKPSNIIIDSRSATDEPRAVIIDFGIAVHNDRVGRGTLSYAGQFFTGTPGYISPEAIKGDVVALQADIYSLGCVMFEALTGRPPFSGPGPLETIRMHVEEQAPALSAVSGVEFTAEIEELISKCLRKDPQERFQTMDEFHEALRVAVPMIAPSSARTLAQNVLQPAIDLPWQVAIEQTARRFNRRTWIFGSVVALVALLVPLMFYLKNSHEVSDPSLTAPELKTLKYGKTYKKVEQAGPRFQFSGDEGELKIKTRENVVITDKDLSVLGKEIREDKDFSRLIGGGTPMRLDLLDQDINGSGFIHLKELPITFLSLRNSDVSDDSLKTLASIDTLDSVLACDCKKLTDKVFPILSNIRRLKYLQIGNGRMTSLGLKAMPSFSNLVELFLIEFELNGDNIKSIAMAPQLTKLRLRGCRLTADAYAELARHPQITTFGLQDTTIGTKEVLAISRLRQLEVLRFIHCQFEAKDHSALRGLKTLKKVRIQDCRKIPRDLIESLPSGCEVESE